MQFPFTLFSRFCVGIFNPPPPLIFLKRQHGLIWTGRYIFTDVPAPMSVNITAISSSHFFLQVFLQRSWELSDTCDLRRFFLHNFNIFQHTTPPSYLNKLFSRFFFRFLFCILFCSFLGKNMIAKNLNVQNWKMNIYFSNEVMNIFPSPFFFKKKFMMNLCHL